MQFQEALAWTCVPSAIHRQEVSHFWPQPHSPAGRAAGTRVPDHMVSSASGLRSHARMPFRGSQIRKHPRMGTFRGTPQTLALLIQHQRDSHTRYSNSTITLNDNSHKSSLWEDTPLLFLLEKPQQSSRMLQKKWGERLDVSLYQTQGDSPTILQLRTSLYLPQNNGKSGQSLQMISQFQGCTTIGNLKAGNGENNFSYSNCLIRFSTQRKHFGSPKTVMRQSTYLGEAELKVGNLGTSNEAFQ